MVTVSSNGTTAGTGIVWVSACPMSSSDCWHAFAPGRVLAFDAEDVSKPPLWSSDGNPADASGLFAKFSPPTVANGKVYVGTATPTNAVRVYGLKP
jgi:outer membrane protein assembly factor BamB